MGLAERRVAKEFETNKYPGLKKNIEDAAKFAVSVEVNWETLSTPEQAHLYDECWPKVYFEPLAEALKDITRDDMGAEALKGQLKKIVVQNTKENANGSAWAEFSGGVLTLDHRPCTNIDDVAERTDGIKRVLEAAL